ncbi:MAG TPA: hypothetical protein VHB27_00755 [Rhodopila sp.]|uniref:hypothetical protein n=1 Tax=Rhodopila sp. TaxID=2480087 RepID=UPI002CCCF167|nr:hypothetical protein [Rhodopila sp.]HVY13725.1 hypothetical protein [Rhodopila sp.]
MNLDDAEPAEAGAGTDQDAEPDGRDAYQALRNEYEARLLQANLRTEAVRAGMIDLDGLRLIDPTTVKLDENGNIVDGKVLMAGLRKKKPWLFGSMSSSSITRPPASAPARPKMAMEMSDEEYAAARAAVTRYVP